MITLKKVNLQDAFSLVNEYSEPTIVGELNDQEIRLLKLKGECTWHHHEKEDGMFLVIKGNLTICFHTGDIMLNEGDFIIIPRGVEYKLIAFDETHVFLFEPRLGLKHQHWK